jgi:parallel beta-helix repeat protein
MDKNPLIRKGLAVGIILLFVGTCVIPAMAQNRATSNQLSRGTTITVDDDGDGDYTSIKDAVNHSNPGDIIEVYSGTYLEGEKIIMNIPEITLNGIPYELGGGNGTGGPLIQCSYVIFWVTADKTTISGFIMQKEIGQGDLIDVDSVNGCLISNNTIQNGTEYPNTGIDCFNSTSVQIINNIIKNIDGDGIFFEESDNACICGNSISNSECGIFIDSSESINITKNMIDGCDVGIRLGSSYNMTLYLNNLESNSIGLTLELSGKNNIKHNNFINNSRDAGWLAVKIPITQRWKSIRNQWIDNYWNDWIKKGPKMIPGVIFILIGIIPGVEIFLPIGIPLLLFQFDWHPAQEPYDIPVGV